MGGSPAGGQHAARNPTLELAAGGASPKQQAPSRRYLRACKGGQAQRRGSRRSKDAGGVCLGCMCSSHPIPKATPRHCADRVACMRGIAENVAAVHHHDMQRGGGWR
jgi:hypothetical protein